MIWLLKVLKCYDHTYTSLICKSPKNANTIIYLTTKQIWKIHQKQANTTVPIIYLLYLFVKDFMTYIKTYSHQLYSSETLWQNWNSISCLSAISLSITKYLSKTSPKRSILLLEWFKRLNECLQSWIVVLFGTSFQT